MDMRLLVQKLRKLDAIEAVRFIDGCDRGKVALVHASLKDDVALLDFFQYLVDNLKTPFAGVRVSGSATPGGYVEDAIAIAVLCGDFEVKVFHEKIDFENPEEASENLSANFDAVDLCLIYSANYLNQSVLLDALLRRVQKAQPHLQILGGVSAPKPLLATNERVYAENVVCVTLKGVKLDFQIETGFRFRADSEEFTITKADEYHVYEINNKNAVEEYGRIQHIRPYFLNMLLRYALLNLDFSKIAKSMIKASRIIRESSRAVTTDLLGTKIDAGMIEPLCVIELIEESKSYLHAVSYKPRDTVLKRTETSKEEQLNIYETIYKKFRGSNALLIISCVAIQFWIDFDYKALEEKLGKFKCPFLLSFVFGEFGATLPYRGLEQNVVHGGTVKALAFK